jgi:hypothetical protein
MKALARKFDAKLTFEDGETVGMIDLDGIRMSIVTELASGASVHAVI